MSLDRIIDPYPSAIRKWKPINASIDIIILEYQITSTYPKTFEILSPHPNIVGCKLSHGDVSKHVLIASNPRIDHETFQAFTGPGQQLLPAQTVGCAGAIDGLAGIFPQSVVHLFNLFSAGPANAPKWKEMREIQYKVSVAEELVMN